METDRTIAYCGVDCAACPDRAAGKCPGCRDTAWGEDPCLPVKCCREKGIDVCGACADFPCKDMAGFYEESEGHREAYRRMCAGAAAFPDARIKHGNIAIGRQV